MAHLDLDHGGLIWQRFESERSKIGSNTYTLIIILVWNGIDLSQCLRRMCDVGPITSNTLYSNQTAGKSCMNEGFKYEPHFFLFSIEHVRKAMIAKQNHILVVCSLYQP